MAWRNAIQMAVTKLVAAERAIAELRVAKDRDIRMAHVDSDRALEIAEIEKAVELARKSQERSSAIAAAAAVRSKAVQAEEQALTIREKEIAERAFEQEIAAGKWPVQRALTGDGQPCRVDRVSIHGPP